MSITLSNEKKLALVESIKRYSRENFEEELGDLGADLLLDFIIRECGPVIYNTAVKDAQVYMDEKVIDMDSSLYKPEDQYWS